MRISRRTAALLLVVAALVAASLACDDHPEITGWFVGPDYPITPVPIPTSSMDDFVATHEAEMMATVRAANPNSPQINAMWDSSGAQTSNLYRSGYAPTTPFSQLFGNLDQAATIASMKAAIPDLKYNRRMLIQQGAWAALAYDLTGTFTQPLVTANGTLPPTNQPWFTTVHTIFHLDADGKIDQEYSVTDMAAMLHEAGVPGYENVLAHQADIDKPMPEEIPSDDPTTRAYIHAVMTAIGGGPFSTWLPYEFGNLPVTYHSPYGDTEGVLPEVESQLVDLTDAQVALPVIITQGNSAAVLYRYYGIIPSTYPIKFSNGVTVQPSDTPIQFIGIALGDVDATGHIQAWNMINRLDNPVSPDTYAPAPGIITTQELGPEVTPIVEDYGDDFGDDSDVTNTELPPETDSQTTQPAPVATPSPASGAATTSCAVTAPQKANLRQGAGTSFAIGGSLAAGQSADADGQANDGNGKAWYHLSAENLWVRSDLVSGDCNSLPTITP